MSAVPNPSLSDPLCLDGLEPLLDQIFAPAVHNEFAPGISTVERTNRLQSNVAYFSAGVANSTSEPEVLSEVPFAEAYDAPWISESTDASPTNGSHVDFYANEFGSAEAARNELLSKQLTELREELKEFQFNYRHLQLELASKQDQLSYLPELFSKVLSLATVEAENAELKVENAALLNTIEHLRPKVHQPSMGRRIINRFFGL